MKKFLFLSILFWVMYPTKAEAEIPTVELISTVELLKPETKPEKPKPKEVIVNLGDTLTKLAKTHDTTVERLWEKNLHIADPDVIKSLDKLVVPEKDEALKPRPFPVKVTPVAPALVQSAPRRIDSAGSIVSRGGSGNTYSRGYCTWHVKNMRPDLPNSLGNADTWYYRAQAQGIPIGTAPRVGAAGMTRAYMHVVYITAVHANGTVSLSEMNYRGNGGGFGIVSTRVAPASEFLYIY